MNVVAHMLLLLLPKSTLSLPNRRFELKPHIHISQHKQKQLCIRNVSTLCEERTMFKCCRMLHTHIKAAAVGASEAAGGHTVCEQSNWYSVAHKKNRKHKNKQKSLSEQRFSFPYVMCIPKCVCVFHSKTSKKIEMLRIYHHILTLSQSVMADGTQVYVWRRARDRYRELVKEREKVEKFVDARASACSFACHVKRILIIIRDRGTKRHILSHVPLLPLLDSTYVLTGRKHRMGTGERGLNMCNTYTIWWGNMSTGQFRYRHSINNYFWSIVCDKLKRQQR